jgi:hypothetical protein
MSPDETPQPTLQPRLVGDAFQIDPAHLDRPLTKGEIALLAWTREHLPEIRADIATWSDEAILTALMELTLLWHEVHGEPPTALDVSRLFGIPMTAAQERLNRLFERSCVLRLSQIEKELDDPSLDDLPPFRRSKIRSRLRQEKRALQSQLDGYHAFIGEHGLQSDPAQLAE